MAFDLNKNTGSAKFDLSKTESKETVVTADTSKSKKTIIGLLAFLLAGAGFWYYTSKGVTEKDKHVAIPELNPADKRVAIASGTKDLKGGHVVEQEAEAELKPTPGNKAAAVLFHHKIAATFAPGSSSVDQMNPALVMQLLSYLTENPDVVVQINGYASSDGALEVNKIVSQARAEAFKQYLLSKDVSESRIVALGKGIENPIATNDTHAGRKKNRRVEIILP